MLRNFSYIFVVMLITVKASAANILILGDSISAGYGINPDKGWVALLGQHLQKNNPDYQLINASVSGETSGGGLARLPALLEQFKPELLIVELGGNDGLRGYPINSLKHNLNTILQMGQSSGAKTLLLGMQIPPNYGKRYSRLFSASFSAAAEQNNTLLMPFFIEKVALEKELMQKDGIHPSEAAQVIILDAVLPFIDKALLQKP